MAKNTIENAKLKRNGDRYMHISVGRDFSSTALSMISSVPSEEETEKQLANARELLARVEEMISNKEKKQIAKESSSEEKRLKVTKFTKDDGSGLSTFDGELMAELSKEEEWEVRGLMDVFDDGLDDAIDALNEIEDEAREALKDIDDIDNIDADDKAKLKKKFFFTSTPTTHRLAKRDVGSSVVNMRSKMNTKDFDRIFDRRNRWIGEP
jgi:hypothetical protein